MKNSEKAKQFFYKKLKKCTYIRPGSMFCVDVPFDKDKKTITLFSYKNTLYKNIDRHPLSIPSEGHRFSITSPLRSKGGGIESGTLGKTP